MSDRQDSWADWRLRVRVWVERDGEAILGEGRLELLEWIDRSRSISAAARQVGVSYRHAWVQVQAINRAAGEALVEAATGGAGGGGAQLTARGREAVALVRELRDRLRREAAGLFSRVKSGPAPAEALHVLAAVSMEDVLDQLTIDYALSRPGAQIRTILGASDELAEQALAGAAADIFLSADLAQLKRLANAGLASEASISVLAENTLVAIGGADSRFTAKQAKDLLAPTIGRLALAVPRCPLGRYTQAYLDGLELYDAVLARAVQVDNSRAVVAAVQAGHAGAGFVYGSAVPPAAGCRVLFRVPRSAAGVTYYGAVLKTGRQQERAKDFLAFLTSKTAQRRFQRGGFMISRMSERRRKRRSRST